MPCGLRTKRETRQWIVLSKKITDNIVTVCLFVKVLMHSHIMIYVRSPSLIGQLYTSDPADY